MQIVIDISEDMYHDIIDGILDLRDSDTRIAVGTWLNKAVPNSTVLPKGHGKLIDVGQCDKRTSYKNCGGYDSLITVKSAFDMLMSLPTIIEADKGSEE